MKRRPDFPARRPRPYARGRPRGGSSQFLYTRHRVLSAWLTPARRALDRGVCHRGPGRSGANRSEPAPRFPFARRSVLVASGSVRGTLLASGSPLRGRPVAGDAARPRARRRHQSANRRGSRASRANDHRAPQPRQRRTRTAKSAPQRDRHHPGVHGGGAAPPPGGPGSTHRHRGARSAPARPRTSLRAWHGHPRRAPHRRNEPAVPA